MNHTDNDKPDHGTGQQEQQPWPFPVRKQPDPNEQPSDDEVIERTLPTRPSRGENT